ncbi:MAG TPA: class I SAM-dependent methyltransferase [Bryobacteraceae bacterium]|jgi:ubiquinone/menaquinone biosynthesis C-methylase UbiE|nr:class I SAM-dependent methyltransferase [Bryobacteraceae bacterium]
MPRTEIGSQPQTLSPSEYATADRFNQAEFANIAHYEQDFWWYRGMRAIQLGLLDRYLKGRKIRCALEAGCGTGYVARVLQQDRKLPLVALDYSERGLRWGMREGLKCASQGSLLDLPFAEQSFDAAMAFDVLQQFRPGEERRAIVEMARVLRPGGLLALRVSAFAMLRSRHSEHVHEAQRFRRGQLKGLVEAAGFRVLRATYANALLSPVALVKFRLMEPLTAKGAESGIQAVSPWLDSVLYGALAAEAAWLRAGFNFPFGQSLLLFAEKRGGERG